MGAEKRIGIGAAFVWLTPQVVFHRPGRDP
jgi:hypothetical protein